MARTTPMRVEHLRTIRRWADEGVDHQIIADQLRDTGVSVPRSAEPIPDRRVQQVGPLEEAGYNLPGLSPGDPSRWTRQAVEALLAAPEMQDLPNSGEVALTVA